MTYVNQLTFGWLLGFWLACLFAFIIRNPLYSYIKLLLEDPQEVTFIKKHILVVAALTSIMMLFSVI